MLGRFYAASKTLNSESNVIGLLSKTIELGAANARALIGLPIKVLPISNVWTISGKLWPIFVIIASTSFISK